MSFASPQDEANHYRKRCKELESALLETQSALDEFQQSSKDLEQELEKELSIMEKHNKDMLKKNEALRNEVETWKTKHQNATKESNTNMSKVQREMDHLTALHNKYKVQLRDMELDNDDLEKSERANLSSLMDMELKYNREVEKNALLEQEVQLKNDLEIEVQRLKDELRDANLELSVRKQKRNPPSPPPSENGFHAIVDSRIPTPSSRLAAGRSSSAVRSASRLSTAASDAGDGPPQNPVKAIQDMVGRVKSLEARLANCRSLVSPLLASTSYAASLRNNSRPGSPRSATPSRIAQRMALSRQSMRTPTDTADKPKQI